MSKTSKEKHIGYQDVIDINDYRNRIYRGLVTAGAIFMFPFAVNNLIQGRYLLGLLSTMVVLVFGINAIALYKNNHSWSSPYITLLVIIIANVYAIFVLGIRGTYWSYPVVILIFFTLDKKRATLMVALQLMAIMPAVMSELSTEIQTRVFMTLLMTAIFAYIFSSIIQRLQDDLCKLAATDHLTGLLNRRQMQFSINDTIARYKRYKTPAALVCVDIDHFKKINDEHGHPSGDCILKQVADLILSRMRAMDHAFRSGGEEFILLLQDTTAEQASLLAESLRKLISNEVDLEGINITISAGVCGVMGDFDFSRWMKCTDKALYKAKANGRNQVYTISESECMVC